MVGVLQTSWFSRAAVRSSLINPGPLGQPFTPQGVCFATRRRNNLRDDRSCGWRLLKSGGALNTETLLIATAIVEASLALGMLVSEYGQRRPGWRLWAASSGMRALSNLVYFAPLAFVPLMQRPVTFLASLLVLASAALSMRSIAQFVGTRPPRWPDLAPWLLCVGAYVAAFWVYGDTRWRIAMISFGLAYGFGWACWRIWTAPGSIEHERRFAAVALGGWCILLVSRAVYALTLGNVPENLLRAQAMHPWYFLAYLSRPWPPWWRCWQCAIASC